MSDQANTKSSGSASAFILGGVLTALMVVGYLVYANSGDIGDEPDVSISVPEVGSIEGDIDGN